MAIKGLDAFKQLNLGTSKDVLEGKPNSPLADLLQLMLQEVHDRLGDSLDSYGISASNNLKQGLAVSRVSTIQNTLSIEITADFYWKYINYGVNGTETNRGAPNWGPAPKQDLSFKDSILRWIPAKGVPLPQAFKTYESFAYAIMTNKKKHGQEARPFVSDVISEKLIREIQEPIQNMIGRAIEIQITEGWL